MTSDGFGVPGGFGHGDHADWLAAVEATLRGASFEQRLVTPTHEGIALQPLYHGGDASSDAAGFPGLPPFTRGGAPLSAAPSCWDLRQEYGYPSVERTAAALRADLECGLSSAWIQLDAAARAGRDHDDSSSLQLAGQDGTLVASVGELRQLLQPVDLGRVPITLDAGSSALPAAALLVAVAGQRQVALDQLSGSLGCDPLGALAADGSLPCSLAGAASQLADLAAWCSVEAPGLRAAHVSTLPYHRAGASAVQELAIALATGVGYLRAMESRGLSVDRAAGQLLFVFALRSDIFMAIAKLRAARSLWSRVISACGGSHEAARMVLHARTSPADRTVRDPWVNLLRSTTQCFAAVAGGADSVHLGSFDDAIGLPDDFSRRVALGTQLVLHEEARLSAVADPAGGSWYVEQLTQELIRAAWTEFQSIESAGGVRDGLERGWLAERLARVAAARAGATARREDPITGVSEFPNLREEAVVREPPDLDDLADLAGCALAAWRADHPMVDVSSLASTPVGRGLATREAVALAGDGATLGALAGALRGDQQPVRCAALPRLRQAEGFEALRDQSDRYLERHGRRPAVFLACLGPVPRHRARALWSANLIAAGGFEALGQVGFDSAGQAAAGFDQARRDQGALAAVICGADADYPGIVPELAALLRAAGAGAVLLAGRPGQREAEWRAAGVSHFMHMGCDVLAVLMDLQGQLGVRS